MNWSALRNNRCPKCGGELVAAASILPALKCAKESCTFFITEKRFGEICTSRNTRALERTTPDEEDMHSGGRGYREW